MKDRYLTTAVRRERHRRESFVEKEHAVVEGVDISGRWNKMYEPREITSYDLTYLDKLTEIEGAESMGWCYQCAQCIPACPVDTVGGDYGPRKIFRKLQTGVDIFNHQDMWLCTSCQNCVRVCPKEVDMVKIMPAARAVAVLDGNPVPEELVEMFQATAEYGNPMGDSPRKRPRWTRKCRGRRAHPAEGARSRSKCSGSWATTTPTTSAVSMRPGRWPASSPSGDRFRGPRGG